MLVHFCTRIADIPMVAVSKYIAHSLCPEIVLWFSPTIHGSFSRLSSNVFLTEHLSYGVQCYRCDLLNFLLLRTKHIPCFMLIFLLNLCFFSCDGGCLRSFHPTKEHGERSMCTTLGLTEAKWQKHKALGVYDIF